MAATAKMCACGRELALCSKCIAELVEGQRPSHNTCVMPLPTLVEVENYASGDLMLPLLNNSERNIIRSVYEFIRSRQQHNT